MYIYLHEEVPFSPRVEGGKVCPVLVLAKLLSTIPASGTTSVAVEYEGSSSNVLASK